MTASAHELPSGTVTFLFTDIEGSTRLLQQLGARYDDCLDEHRRLVRAAVEAEGGYEVNTEGDAFFIVFASAARAAAAAVRAQRALATTSWPEGAAIKVRMGLHTGEATPVGRDYVGLDVHRAARICSAAWGGQILLSQATKILIEPTLPPGAGLRDLGEHRLKDLLRPERIYQLSATDLQPEFPSIRTVDTIPNNLPIQLTSFIGRDHEVTEARRLLGTARLLTLTGPGGTGKTRLALQLAAEVIEQFPDGVYFVPLAPITDPGLVASTIAQSLGLHESGGQGPVDRLQEFLRDKRLLLLLDNFEQVLPAAPLLNDLLKFSVGLKILVTSRAILRLYGEQEFGVPPLRLPDPHHLPALESLSQYGAVVLFIQRAVTVKPDFTVTNDNAPAVAEITARLDGLPLAIELAAARIKLLTPQAMLARLERRLSLLSVGARDLPVRQQTLRDAIAWSHDLLDEGGRRLLARFSVFVGGATLEAAEAVCGPAADLGRDVFDGLAGLVDQSLLRQEEAQGEPRFVMLETIREFATERLDAGGEAGEIRRRHAMTYLTLVEQAEPEFLGPRGTVWLDRVEDEHDNLRAAIAWAVERDDAELAMRLAASLWRFWQMRGHLREARERLGAIVAMRSAAAHPGTKARALEAAGGIAYWQGDLPGARAFYSESLTLQRELGNQAGIAGALYNLAFTFFVNQDDLPRARGLLEECLALYSTLEDRASIARTRWGLASMEYMDSNLDAALGHLNISLPIFRQADDRFSLGWALHLLGVIKTRTRDVDAARAALREGLGLFAERRDVSGMVMLLDDLSGLATAEGDFVRAARLAGGAAALQRQSGTGLAAILNAVEGRARPGEREATEQAIAAAWAEGQEAETDRLIEYALGRAPEL